VNRVLAITLFLAQVIKFVPAATKRLLGGKMRHEKNVFPIDLPVKAVQAVL
jgi:hypothetical protein